MAVKDQRHPENGCESFKSGFHIGKTHLSQDKNRLLLFPSQENGECQPN